MVVPGSEWPEVSPRSSQTLEGGEGGKDEGRAKSSVPEPCACCASSFLSQILAPAVLARAYSRDLDRWASPAEFRSHVIRFHFDWT